MNHTKNSKPADQKAPLRRRSLPRLAYTVDEACDVAVMGRTTLYEEITAGRLKARKRGRSTIILAGDLAAYLAALPAAESGV
jgi:excisionase family DNA binding protein